MAGNLNSPRKRALEIGTDPKGFHGDVKVDSGGVPAGHPSHGEYHDAVCDTNAAASKAPAVQPYGSPFKIGGAK